MKLNIGKSPLVISSISLLLSACGGGSPSADNSNSSTNNSNSTTNQVTSSSLPHIISARHWNSSDTLSTVNNTQTDLEIVGSKLLLKIKSADLSKGNHVQIYLNTDNKSETGFQFEGQAWAKSGVDYIIEDGILFKSTANNTGWNWNTHTGNITYAVSFDILSIDIDMSLLGDICNNLKVGVMTRDSGWNIASFYPASSRMQNFNVPNCNKKGVDTIKPVITLKGANPQSITAGSTFNNLGASAIDNIDGDISSKIIASSNVNTSIAGNYEVNYQVADAAGNIASLNRNVIVTEVVNDGIVIDGSSDDWSNIGALSSTANGILKVSDDAENIYILVTSSNIGKNTQVLLDTDQSINSGLILNSTLDPWQAGIDYMVENNSLDKSTSNSQQWAWDYGIAPIDFVKTTDTLEIAIKKSDFNFIANSLSIGFVSRDEQWNINYLLPKEQIPTYTMQFPVASNPVRANNDAGTTTNDKKLTIDVLANDISSGNLPLILQSVSQPSSGTASILQNKIEYSPIAGFTGTSTFSYQVKNANGDIDKANISIIVTAPIIVNTPPVAVNDSVNTEEGKSVIINALNNDTDADHDILALTSVTKPANGTAEISSGKISYNPAAGFVGTDTFNYDISDNNGGTDTAKITVIVSASPNRSPDAVEDVANVDFDKTITVNVLSNDTDPDGDTLTVQSIVQPSPGVAFLNADGTIFFNPQNNVGSFSISYTVTDGRGGTDIATLTIASTDPNDGNDNYPNITNENVRTPKNTPVFIDVLANDTDADGDILVLDQVDQGEHGTTVKINGGVRYTPNPGFTGTDIFYYGVHDGHGHNGSGFVAITVTP